MSAQISHHLLLCATPSKAACCSPDLGEESWSYLKQVIKNLGLDNTKRSEGIVLRSKVDCLRICNRGPILLIWPDGIWYDKISPKRIDLIIEKHILEGQPVEKWIIKKTPFNNHPINKKA